MPRKYTPLRIHVWGGLGSQLFAIALSMEISRKYPSRKIKLVLHSSGVTKRSPEICELFPEFDYQIVDDFRTRETHDSQVRSFSINKILRATFRNLALFTALLAEENNGHSRKVRRWTLSIRGHYFHRSINEDFVALLRGRLENIASINVEKFRQETVIHYRLGDLLELSNKSNVNPNRIRNAVLQNLQTSEVTIFSDSTEKALTLLKGGLSDIRLVPGDLSALNILWAASSAGTFIGTSSKISYWICILRFSRDRHLQSFLPKEDKLIIDTISIVKSDIQYY
ncbi:hypothetical protein MCEMRE212_00042 [Candidatus Nanopelagicaceae bacterium]